MKANCKQMSETNRKQTEGIAFGTVLFALVQYIKFNINVGWPR